MISWGDLYTVLTAVIPLYVSMNLAYGSVRWWKIFSHEECSGINWFVAISAVPLLSFHFISTNYPYAMTFKFIAADTLQKLIVLFALGLCANFTTNGSLEWMITIFSLSTLPNTLVMGIPLLIAMYGEYSGMLMVLVVVLQCIIWYTLLLFLFEYRGDKMLIMEQFPETAASIVSFKVDSDVLHIVVRKSNASRRSLGPGSLPALTPKPSNLTGGSNFNNSDFYSMMGIQGFPVRQSNFSPADLYSVQSSRGLTPRPSNFEENSTVMSPRFGFHPAQSVPSSYPAPNPEIFSLTKNASKNSQAQHQQENNKVNHDAKELHMFVWSSSALPASEGDGLHVSGGADFGASEQSGRCDQVAKEIRMLVAGHSQNGETKGPIVIFFFRGNQNTKETPKGDFRFPFSLAVFFFCSFFILHLSIVFFKRKQKEKDVPRDWTDCPFSVVIGVRGMVRRASKRGDEPSRLWHQKERKILPLQVYRRNPRLLRPNRSLDGGPNELNKLKSNSIAELHPNAAAGAPTSGGKQMPPASVMIRLILIMKSISILSDAGLGMAMFSLGLFMALQPKLIARGNSVATFAMAVRFLTGPAVMAAASIAAALPQGIVPFVFAKEYNVHPAILSIAVIFGMLIALPITLVYYILLEL
ncbi:hypothetical protein ES288_D02G178700v1 [Gossypium darwinii]|uniref:Auxin efflux carrier component n=1 Tax=Gossypium darwinii TaxID=34276 RepID=A0A5D2DFU3_GOSDA|nr:hypothetical protein ES288_D02G178700v1 [Gossypium darwinii]